MQTWSKSQGITPEEEAELTQVTDYRWRRSVLEGRKPFEALPPAFGLRRLRSGRLALFQSRAVRRDHVGRPGSYIAHAFVFTASTYETLQPSIRYWGSPSFRNHLTEAEIQSTMRPALLPALSQDQLAVSDDGVVSALPAFMQARGAEKVAELLGATFGDAVPKRGPIVVAGPMQHCLLAILALEVYRRAPVFFVTFAADSGFNRDFSGAEPYELCGDFGSRELAANWRDCHRAWLFEWDAPPPVGFVAPNWLREFVAGGGELRHHRYMNPEGYTVIPKIDGWLNWQRQVGTVARGEARELIMYAVRSGNASLRAHAFDDVSATLDATLRIVGGREVASLVARISADISGPQDAHRIADRICAAIVEICRFRESDAGTLGELIRSLRGTPITDHIARTLMSRLMRDADHSSPEIGWNDRQTDAEGFAGAVPTAISAVRMLTIVLGLQRRDVELDDAGASVRTIRRVVRHNGAISILLSVSYELDDTFLLRTVVNACRADCDAMSAFGNQLETWSERQLQIRNESETVLAITRWLLAGADRELTSGALGHVLGSVRLASDELHTLLTSVVASELDRDRRLSLELIRACARSDQNTLPTHLDTLLTCARTTGKPEAVTLVLAAAERHSDRIGRMRFEARGPLLRRLYDELSRESRKDPTPRLDALVWIDSAVYDPRRFCRLSMLRTHLDAIRSFEDTTRTHLITSLVRAALRRRSYGETSILTAWEFVRQFVDDPAVNGVLSRAIETTERFDYETRRDTVIARTELETSKAIAPYVNDDLLGSWLVATPYLWVDVQNYFRRRGRHCDVETMQKFADKMPPVSRRIWR